MNLEYLKSEILPVREREIAEGKNLATSPPIYIVYSLDQQLVYGHVEGLGHFSKSGVGSTFGYIEQGFDWDDSDFSEHESDLTNPEKITLFYTDRYVALFLTSEAAYDYLKYQAHNMNKPFVYVEHTGYANHQMNGLFSG